MGPPLLLSLVSHGTLAPIGCPVLGDFVHPAFFSNAVALLFPARIGLSSTQFPMRLVSTPLS